MEVRRSVEMIFWSISTNYVSELKFYLVTPGSAVRLTAMETCWTSRRQKWLQKVFYDQLLRKLWGQTGIWTYKQACYRLLCGFQHVKFKTSLIWDNVKQSCQPSCWAISHRNCLWICGTFIRSHKLNFCIRLPATAAEAQNSPFWKPQ